MVKGIEGVMVAVDVKLEREVKGSKGGEVNVREKVEMG